MTKRKFYQPSKAEYDLLIRIFNHGDPILINAFRIYLKRSCNIDLEIELIRGRSFND